VEQKGAELMVNIEPLRIPLAFYRLVNRNLLSHLTRESQERTEGRMREWLGRMSQEETLDFWLLRSITGLPESRAEQFLYLCRHFGYLDGRNQFRVTELGRSL